MPNFCYFLIQNFSNFFLIFLSPLNIFCCKIRTLPSKYLVNNSILIVADIKTNLRSSLFRIISAIKPKFLFETFFSKSESWINFIYLKYGVQKGLHFFRGIFRRFLEKLSDYFYFLCIFLDPVRVLVLNKKPFLLDGE